MTGDLLVVPRSRLARLEFVCARSFSSRKMKPSPGVRPTQARLRVWQRPQAGRARSHYFSLASQSPPQTFNLDRTYFGLCGSTWETGASNAHFVHINVSCKTYKSQDLQHSQVTSAAVLISLHAHASCGEILPLLRDGGEYRLDLSIMDHRACLTKLGSSSIREPPCWEWFQEESLKAGRELRRVTRSLS